MTTRFSLKTGDDIQRFRRRLGLTQSEFWECVCVTQSGGSRYESGRDIPEPVQLLLTLAFAPQEEAERRFMELRERAGS